MEGRNARRAADNTMNDGHAVVVDVVDEHCISHGIATNGICSILL